MMTKKQVLYNVIREACGSLEMGTDMWGNPALLLRYSVNLIIPNPSIKRQPFSKELTIYEHFYEEVLKYVPAASKDEISILVNNIAGKFI